MRSRGMGEANNMNAVGINLRLLFVAYQTIDTRPVIG
jgi:hypothetical protein